MIRIIIIAMFLFCSCSEKKPTAQVKKTVAVSNFPMFWLVEKIAGDTVNLQFPVPSDIDPAYWSPEDKDILGMQQADLILLNGATYEKWLKGTSLPAGKTVDTSIDTKSAFIKLEDETEHEHNGVKHKHTGTDFNIWLDSYIYSIQAQTITDALIKLNPEKKQEYETALTTLKKKLKTVFIDLNNASKSQDKYLASHPVYNYLAKANGWKVQNFHWEPDEMPSEEEWSKLKEALSFSKYMLWEDTPSKEISDRLMKEGVKIIVFRTCGNRPPGGDFFSEMIKNIENLKNALAANK